MTWGSKGRKDRVSLRELYEFLCSLKNEAGWSQAPAGKNLIQFLQKHYGYSSPQSIQQKLIRLAQSGYIEQHHRGRVLFRVKPLKNEWSESDQANYSNPKKFAIFFDYKNLEINLRDKDRFNDFSWLMDPLLKEGKIIFAFVFIPDHYANRVPLIMLANKHRFQPILCPRELGKTTTKDKDTVDAKMEDLGKAILEHSDITDIIIVSGDSDFQELSVFAKWQQKSVKVISAASAVSPRFLEMKNANQIDLKPV